MSQPPKIQRWIDLLAALLRRHFAATFEELARDVPAYAEGARSDDPKTKGAVMRMFERDKDELRAFGILIRSEVSSDGESYGYRLAARDFYLPYVALHTANGASRPANTTREFYRALAHLSFEPDELAAVVDAAARVGQLGDPLLAADARGAHRKLAFDLPTDAVRPDPAAPTVHAAKADRNDPRTFEALGDALRRRKVLTFGYHAMHTDSVATRTVDPYGLFFLGGHWYLVGRDHDRDALRNFRVSRVRDPEANGKAPAKPDYDIPAGFDLEAHATAKSTWELGDAPSATAIVEFRNLTGPVAAAARLGDPVDDASSGTTRRRFVVRRRDAFARWLLSFGGDAVPVEPAALVDEFRQLAAATRARYAGVEGA